MNLNSFKEFINEYAIAIIAISMLATVGIPFSIQDARVRNENYAILNNPSFVGEVVNKETRRLNGMSPMLSYTQYRMHIVGHYYIIDKKVQIDRIFIVNSELFHLYDIDDVITRENFGGS